MNLEELRQQLEAKKVEIRGFIDEKKATEAEMAVEEKRSLEKLITMQEDIEADEKRELENQKSKKGNKNTMGKVNGFRSAVKNAFGVNMTEEERALITILKENEEQRESIKSDNVSTLIPDEFVNQVIEIQKGFGALKGYCDVISVGKNQGTIPVVNLDQGDLEDIDEGDAITDGTLVSDEVTFTCSKVGLIQTLTSETIDDAEVEVEGIVKTIFANNATVKENSKILKVIKDNAVEYTNGTIADYELIEMAIDTTVPSAKLGLSTITNVNGYAYLKNKKDLKGRPLDLITMVNGVEMFHGKPIIVVDDGFLPVTEDKNYVFYIANMKEAVKYIERKGISIARSTEAGFNDDTVKLRILERMTAIKGSARSVKRIEF